MKKIIPALILFSILGFLAYRYFSNAPKTTTPSIEKEKDDVELLPKDKWKIYENKKYGYKIAWHTDWHKQNDNEPPYPPPPAGMNFSRHFGEGNVCDFEILSGNKDDFKAEMESRSDKEYEKSESSIGGEKAVKFTLKNKIQLVEVYYFDHGKNSYRLGFNIFNKGKEGSICLDVFRKMIKSFKFTSPTDE